MPFQVYYRKWRPQRFRDLVSQNHVSTTLRQAIQQDRVAHSYLFCGPRGTGKTSTARVLAKATNCLGPEEGDPCNVCGPCMAVNEGRFMDLIELDAASNRGIDEIRNIRDKVNLAPVEGRRKVYIIDEAHMLTEHASNAFLKTLEEPPGHAIFILCTTEPHKILPTIISRCQRFDFRRLTSSAIVERLRTISIEEGVEADGEALEALAHASGGSLRDAENLLEQMVVSYGQTVGLKDVQELLGLDQGEEALELTRYLLVGNTAAALATINRTAWDSGDLRELHRQTVDLVRGVLMLQCGSKDSVDLPGEVMKELEDLSPKTPADRVMRALKLLGEVNLRHDASSPLPLELAVVELSLEEAAQPPASSQLDAAPRPQPARPTAPERPSRQAPAPTAAERGMASPPRTPSVKEAPTRRQMTPSASRSSPPTPQETQQRDGGRSTTPGDAGPGEDTGGPQEQWGTLIKTLSRYKGKRFNIGALLRDCKDQQIEGDTLLLTFAHRSHLERMQEELDDPQGKKTVEDALLKSFGSALGLKLTLSEDNGGATTPSATQSPLVRAALSMGARITEEREL